MADETKFNPAKNVRMTKAFVTSRGTICETYEIAVAVEKEETKQAFAEEYTQRTTINTMERRSNWEIGCYIFKNAKYIREMLDKWGL